MFELVVREVLYALVAGRMLLATLTLVIGGYVIGYAARSIGAKIGLVLVLVFIAAGMIFTSEYMKVMDYGARSGVYPKGFSDNFILTLLGTLIVLTWAGIWFGSHTASEEAAQDIDNALAMTPADFVSEIDILAAHPALSQSGWLAHRWYPMTPEERLQWAERHVEHLRNLRVEFTDSNLGGHGMNLPVRLAQIDHQS